MNDPEQFNLTIDLEADLAVTPQEIKLVADLLPQMIKDILAMQAEKED